MNSHLAQIYGTGGFDKTASEEDTFIDLNEISGAQLLAGLESGELTLPGLDDGEEIEKEAGIDLSQYTGQELLDILSEVEDEGEEILSKMASDGSAEYWDMAGRIMAHAYTDEMNKVASDDEWPEYIDPEAIDGSTMVELIESGAYEIVTEEDMNKEAGVKDWLKSVGRSAKSGGSAAAEVAGATGRAMGESAKAGGRRASDAAKRGANSVKDGAKRGFEGAKDGAKRGFEGAKAGGRRASDAAQSGWGAYKGALSGKGVSKAHKAFKAGTKGSRDSEAVELARQLSRTGAAGGATLGLAGGAAYGGKSVHDKYFKRRR
jgi:hypothetical protein